MRRSWVEINLTQLVRNLEVYSSNLKNVREIMAVVKANAYGHGDIAVAKVLQEHGIHHFAVSNLEEAIHLRENGIEGQILILGYTPIEEAEKLVRYDITQALVDTDYALRLAATALPIKAQFALDTGMNRIGLDAEKPDECEKVIREYARHFTLTGFFTHLCVADTDTAECKSFTSRQIALFTEIVHRVGDLHLPFMHCLNSAGGLWHDCPESALVRLGIILYGLKPDYLNTLPKGLKPVLTWKTVVSMVKSLQAGESVGYGRTFVADHEMRIATLPTGYADGYNRQLSNKGFVIIHGRKAPIVGRVCMDQMTVDVTEIPEVQPDDEVILLNDSTYTADDMAQSIGTIGYEVVCNISSRVTRVYR